MQNKDNVLELVKSGEITPQEAVDKLGSHGDFLSDIEPDLARTTLDVGLKAFIEHEYILSNRGNMVVLAARAGNGKTALACQLGLHASTSKKVLFFSLEMSKKALTERLISVHSNIEIKQLRNPDFAGKVKKARQELKKYKFKIIDTPRLSLNGLLGAVYDENRIEQVGLVIIDYIGLLSRDKTDKRHLDVAEIASKIKTEVADKLGIPVLVLAQMNQGIDGRFATAKLKGKEATVRPLLADIGESKGIADAADVVMFLYRPCINDPFVPREVFQVYVLKNRNGATVDFSLHFSEKLTKFYDKGEYDFV